MKSITIGLIHDREPRANPIPENGPIEFCGPWGRTHYIHGPRTHTEPRAVARDRRYGRLAPDRVSKGSGGNRKLNGERSHDPDVGGHMKRPAQTINGNQPGGVGPDDSAGESGSQSFFRAQGDPPGTQRGCALCVETRGQGAN